MKQDDISRRIHYFNPKVPRQYTKRSGNNLQCTKCGEVKIRTDFALRINGRPHSWCRECKRGYDREASIAKRKVFAQ